MFIRIEIHGDSDERQMKELFNTLSKLPSYAMNTHANNDCEIAPPPPPPDVVVEEAPGLTDAQKRSEAAKKAAETRARNKQAAEALPEEVISAVEIPAVAEEAPAPEAVPEVVEESVTVEMLRVPARWLMQNNFSQDANDAIKEAGGTTLSKVPVENMGALLVALNTLVTSKGGTL